MEKELESIEAVENTAVAAKMVMESGRADVAAISSENCRDLYGMTLISDDVQNKDNNYTRFICISKELCKSSSFIILQGL